MDKVYAITLKSETGEWSSAFAALGIKQQFLMGNLIFDTAGRTGEYTKFGRRNLLFRFISFRRFLAGLFDIAFEKICKDGIFLHEFYAHTVFY